jgi:hypothetical protein
LTRFCSSVVHVPSVHNPRNAPEAGTTFPAPAGPLKKLAGNEVPVEAVDVAAATDAVGADDADCDPFAFEAVTTTRRVVPTSAETGAYVQLVAPEIEAQLPPDVLQRCHRYAYLSPVPVQVPVLAVSVLPTTALPLIDGGVRLTGNWLVDDLLLVDDCPGGSGGFVPCAVGTTNPAATMAPASNVNVLLLIHPPKISRADHSLCARDAMTRRASTIDAPSTSHGERPSLFGRHRRGRSLSLGAKRDSSWLGRSRRP